MAHATTTTTETNTAPEWATATTWPTPEGYTLEVDAQASSIHLRYTNPETARKVTIALGYDHEAKAYTAATAVTSPRNSAHYGTDGAKRRPAEAHTAEAFRAYVTDHAASGWIADRARELAERAPKILPERLEVTDGIDQRPALV